MDNMLFNEAFISRKRSYFSANLTSLQVKRAVTISHNE